MNDRDIINGMKAFVEWHKSYMKESTKVSTCKIPVECIPNPKKVWLTIEDAKSFIKQCDEEIDPADKPYSYSKVRLSILHQIEQAEAEQ